MSKEGEVEVVGQRRKSARILALEEEKRKENLKRSLSVAISNNLSKAGYTGNGSPKNEQHHDLAPSSRAMPAPPPLRRGRKQKRLEDLVLPSFAKSLLQQGEENIHGDSLTRHDQQANGLPSVQWIPEKRILELILDILQRRDTHKIFAQPVDPNEVDNYYTIIKEPMDFSTMRTKLQEGHYTSLEKFEHDVLLITSNAMHFNSSTTIYYKEARGVQDVAQVIFQCLRTDPQKLESRLICATRSGGPGKRPLISEIRGRRAKVPRLGGFKIGPSSLGLRDCRNYGTFSERERPLIPFCRDSDLGVSSVYDAYKPLIHIGKNKKFGYKERLLMFVKNLGPTAQKVAARKLMQCVPNYQAPISNRQQTTQRILLPSPTPSLPLRIPSQSPNIASAVSTLAVISNNVPSRGKNSTFNLNLQASPVDQEIVDSSYGDNKVHEPADNGRLKIDSLLMPPPKEKSPNDRDVFGKKSFISNNKNAENGGRAFKAHLNGSVIAKTSDFNGIMGNFPKTFLREKVVGQQNNTGKTSFIFDNSTSNRGGQMGKVIEEKSDLNDKRDGFPEIYFQEYVTSQLENNIQEPFMLDDDVASDKEIHTKYLLKDKMVAETTNFNEKVETLPGSFVVQDVSGQQENENAAKRGSENQHPLKGKRVAETSDFNEKAGNFPKDFQKGNVAGQLETKGTMSFLIDNNITASRGRDIQHVMKDVMVSETSDRNERIRNISGNFLQENVAGQKENSIHMPFMLLNSIASSGGRDYQYSFEEKTAGDTSAFNEKKGNFPWESIADRPEVVEASAFSEKVGNFSFASVADRLEDSILMPFMLDNNISANGNKDDSDWFKEKTVAEASAFSEKMGNFSWESVADRRENNIQKPFMPYENNVANQNKDDRTWLKGKAVVEASAFSEKKRNFSWESVADRRENIQMLSMLDNNNATYKDDNDRLKGKTVMETRAFSEKVANFSWDSVADRRESSIQMPSMMDNSIAANRNRDDSDWLKGKAVAEASNLSEKVGIFTWESVADQQENSIRMPFMLDSNIAASGNKDGINWLKGKTVVEASASREKVDIFSEEGVADRRENSLLMSFMPDNNISANGNKDDIFWLKGKTVAETSAFSEKVGSFSWESVADRRENSIRIPFVLDNNIATNRNKDGGDWLKGKTVAEASACSEKVGNFTWESVADRRENSIQMPFILDDNIAANRNKDNSDWLKGKAVAETSAFSEKVGNFSWETVADRPEKSIQVFFNGKIEKFPWKNVVGQRENTSQIPFINDAANGENDDSSCLKGKTVAETSAFAENVANFLCESGTGQQENTSQVPFVCDEYTASNGGKDTEHRLLGKVVAEISAFNEKRGICPGNFLKENVASQQENSSQIPFTLDNSIAVNGGGNTKYLMMGKSVAKTSDLNDKMEKNSGNFLRENAAGQHENTSQNKCRLASHFRVIPVYDDGGPYTPNFSTKTKFRTVDMLAEGNNIMNHNNKLQKGKQVEVVQQTSLDSVDQVSTDEWKSRLNDFVDRSNYLSPTLMFSNSKGVKFLYPSPASSDTTDQLNTLDQLDGLDNLQDPMMGQNYGGNYAQALEGGTVSSFPMMFDNDDNSLNQWNYTPMSLQAPALSSCQLGILKPLCNEGSNILHERVDDDPDPQLLYLNDTDQPPDLDLQL